MPKYCTLWSTHDHCSQCLGLMFIWLPFCQMQFDEEPVNVNKWSTSAVKNALDDQAKKVSSNREWCVGAISVVSTAEPKLLHRNTL